MAPEALLRKLGEDLIGQQVERLGDDRLIRRGIIGHDKPFDPTTCWILPAHIRIVGVCRRLGIRRQDVRLRRACGSHIRKRNHQDVIAVLPEGPRAQLRRQGLIGPIAFKRIVRDQDLIDARELGAFEPDAGVPVGLVMRQRARNLKEQGVLGGVLRDRDGKGFAVVGQHDNREKSEAQSLRTCMARIFF